MDGIPGWLRPPRTAPTNSRGGTCCGIPKDNPRCCQSRDKGARKEAPSRSDVRYLRSSREEQQNQSSYRVYGYVHGESLNNLVFYNKFNFSQISMKKQLCMLFISLNIRIMHVNFSSSSSFEAFSKSMFLIAFVELSRHWVKVDCKRNS